MKTETQTQCSLKRGGVACRGALMRDHRISRIEHFIGNRKYTCEKCESSWVFKGAHK